MALLAASGGFWDVYGMRDPFLGYAASGTTTGLMQLSSLAENMW